MAKARKGASKTAAKKSAHKSSKTRAKKAATGHKRKTSRTSSKNMTFFDHLLSIFAGPDPRKT
jgi:hypothetical protein